MEVSICKEQKNIMHGAKITCHAQCVFMKYLKIT